MQSRRMIETPETPNTKTATDYKSEVDVIPLDSLGEIRPIRLLAKLDLDMMGMMNPARPVMITSIEWAGLQDVCFLKTSTKTS